MTSFHTIKSLGALLGASFAATLAIASAAEARGGHSGGGRHVAGMQGGSVRAASIGHIPGIGPRVGGRPIVQDHRGGRPIVQDHRGPRPVVVSPTGSVFGGGVRPQGGKPVPHPSHHHHPHVWGGGGFMTAAYAPAAEACTYEMRRRHGQTYRVRVCAAD